LNGQFLLEVGIFILALIYDNYLLMSTTIKDKKDLNLKKAQAIVKYKEKVPISEIAKSLQKPYTTIKRWIEQFEGTGEMFSVSKRTGGQKSRITQRVEKYLAKKLMENPALTYKQLSNEVSCIKKVSKSTIARYLKERGTKYVPKKQYILSEVNKSKRVAYASHLLSTKLSDIIWSDESKFDLNRNKRRFYRFKGEPRLGKTICNPNYSIMVWGCISTRGRLSLVEIDGRLNATKYKEILENGLFKQADNVFGAGKWRFQQDNAPCHKAKSVMNLFKERGVQVVEHPPNSPDLNPIESIWGVVKKRVEDLQPKTLGELRTCIFTAWKTIKRETVKSTIDHMTSVYQKVIDANGAYSNDD